ncbi:PEP-CTERM sorting domain-containing protein [Moorena sp. SIO4G3]|uniref:alpha/beta hydrolase family protein n=1 Tax=Moorena sp. SIO4G3 TaxID=2607821 RepID=UPI00142CB6B9|nr:PEP-CTERM sorting domain-containing protein [Moorena sp. SIO4G3]NEO74945.1 PEP-CTERM sorting domain-containing protein [Moorena sp. SIO4G3]
MNFSSSRIKYSLSLCSAIVMSFGTAEIATAATFSDAPIFSEVDSFSTTITTNGNPADIYFPVVSRTSNELFPTTILLPGGLVDKSFYSSFATQVASYGFVVVVPNNRVSLPQFNFEGLLPEASQINSIFDFIITESENYNSQLAGIVDTEKLALLGHSQGGAVGLTAIEGSCIFPLCLNDFSRPEALMAAAFYGTNRFDPFLMEFVPTANDGIPVALVQGSLDGVATPEEALATFELIQDSPKALITVAGANHFGITNVNNPPGARPDFSNPTLAQDEAIETIARWSALFLRANLLDDANAFDFVFDTGATLDPNVTVIAELKTVPEPSSLFGVLAIAMGGISWLWQRK